MSWVNLSQGLALELQKDPGETFVKGTEPVYQAL